MLNVATFCLKQYSLAQSEFFSREKTADEDEERTKEAKQVLAGVLESLLIAFNERFRRLRNYR